MAAPSADRTTSASGAQLATRLAAVGGIGAFGAALCFAPVAPVALAGAMLVCVALPGFAVARALVGGDPEADRVDFLAASYGGAAVSSLVLWIAGATVGLSRATILAAPLLASLVLAARPRDVELRRSLPPGFRVLALVSVFFTLLVAVPFYPHGLERSDGVHRTGLSDWYLHIMMASTLDSASSLPPANPYLLAHGRAHYHYAFHLLAAAIHRAAGRPVDVFPILLGLTLFTAAAFPLVLFTLVRRRLGGDPRKALAAAAAGTLLAGFDLVVWATHVVQTLIDRWPPPAGVAGLRLLIPSSHLHAWAPIYERQFNAPYLATLWAPHYVAAVLVSLLCFHAMRRESGRPPLLAVALLLASLPGLSAYVLMATVVGVAAWIAADLARMGWPPSVPPATARWMLAGAGALVFASPVFATLRDSFAQHGAPLILQVSAAGTWRNGAFFTFLFGDHPSTRVLDLPALIVVQFGIVGVLGGIGIWRRVRRRSFDGVAGEHAIVLAAMFAFLVLFRPPTGMDNNLGLRPMLLVWSLLVGFAAEAWFAPARFRALRWMAVAAGAAGTLYGAVGATLEGFLFWPSPPAMVETARWINRNVPIGAPVALDPEDHSRSFDWWLRRPLVEADHERNALMLGARPEEYMAIRRALHETYRTANAAEAAARFLDLGAAVVVVHAGAGQAPPWDELPCFPLRYRNAEWSVLVRTSETCELPR